MIGSGPAGLINAYLLAAEGYPVTVFEAFHELGGVLRYGIPEFRLPNTLIDDVVGKIRLLGGKFVTNFVVGKTATIEDLKDAGFWKIFVGTGAGLPRFMNVPGEHLLGVMSANEFLTRVNLMQARIEDYETPLPEIAGKQVIVIGGGNTAMDAARTARRLGGNVDHRLSPHQGRDAGARRGTAPRAGRGHRAQGAALAPRVRQRRNPIRSATPSSTSWSSARPTPRAGARRSSPARPRRCRSIW